ncbi:MULTISPECIES: SPOR domain-containing protein [unclassified Halomonas]|uniref:SPOR domain-containing protein n=1 Tax=unclassified Halomonas TaxID=2609666 RepID=UPI0006DAE33B|nr:MULTISPECIES: SPOR domain-containing protein [unclassified Halomonas]KPQ26687.1 MAG: DedD protein [Halomonas sp. HL-93]SBR48420.1 DedD protein [Halomonas sp. HL-93]SNY96288.1 DedD protein [Halomonas sp. hl-4]
MKYGKTERISGIVILLALLAIIVPWLMSDPAPREERPQPNFVIEQPVEAERRDVEAPERPDSIDDPAEQEQVDPGVAAQATEEPLEVDPVSPDTDQLANNDESDDDSASDDEDTSNETEEPSADEQSDPIADLIASNSQAVTDSSEEQSSNEQTESTSQADSNGEWAVQVGSFGDADNAQRLSDQLSEEGFTVYQRERDNEMTTVYVGPFATSEEGETAVSDVKQRANVQGLLVRVRE